MASQHTGDENLNTPQVQQYGPMPNGAAKNAADNKAVMQSAGEGTQGGTK